MCCVISTPTIHGQNIVTYLVTFFWNHFIHSQCKIKAYKVECLQKSQKKYQPVKRFGDI